MYCPKCSQPQVSDETMYCSRCGLPLDGLKEMVPADGRAPAGPPPDDKLSPRQKGVRRGVALMLLSLILIPAYVLLAALFPANDQLVESSVSDTPFEKISQAVLATLFMLGLARVVYARLFQPGAGAAEAAAGEGAAEPDRLQGRASSYALPPAQSIPVPGFGSWRTDTGQVAQPPGRASEQTTQSLDED